MSIKSGTACQELIHEMPQENSGSKQINLYGSLPMSVKGFIEFCKRLYGYHPIRILQCHLRAVVFAAQTGSRYGGGERSAHKYAI